MFGNKIYSEGKIKVIHNAVDLRKFAFSPPLRSKIRKDLDAQDKLVIGHIGRFHILRYNH